MANGETSSYTSWASGEPNNAFGNEDCATVTNSAGQWNDVPCSGAIRNIVEWGTLIFNPTSPYTHTGRTNGTTYFYVVTAVNASGESAESAQVSATPTAPDTTAPTTTATPAGGTYSSAQSVTLTANETATIYYTVDGTTPTTASTIYTTPISISTITTLKFFAKDSAGNSEAVKTEV